MDDIYNNIKFSDIITLSDDKINIIDFVVCVDFNNLTPQEEKYLISKDYFKIYGFIDDKIILEDKNKYDTYRFKKINISHKIEVGDYVILHNNNFYKLPDIVIDYLNSKSFFIVYSIRKGKSGINVVDIGIRNNVGISFYLDISRFVSLKTPYEYKFKVIDSNIDLINDNIKNYWINPEKLEITTINRINNDVSVDITIVNVDDRNDKTMLIDSFVEYYEPLTRGHIDIINKKFEDINNMKNEDIKNIMLKYKKPLTFYNNIIKLINKL